MSNLSVSEFELLVQKATSESIPNGELDLPVALELSDTIRSKRISHKDGMRCLKKRIMSTQSNPNTQLSSWKLVDVCIKNGGISFIKEICSREFMDTMENTILKNNDNEEVKELVVRIVYGLYLAFKNDSQLNSVTKVYEKLVNRGIRFPEELDTSNSNLALFDSRTPAEWMDSDACMICSKKFSLLNRRHHCRSCGGIFCQDHSSNNIPLPDLGIYDSVRVCDNCYEDYDSKKSNVKKTKKKHRRKSSKYDSKYDEEEQLRKAIELSLRESSKTEPIIPHIPEPTVVLPQVGEDENDPELKAAIAASLKEAEKEKIRRESVFNQQNQQQGQQHYQQLPELQNYQPQVPQGFDLTSNEENDIYLFASLVEKMKSKTPFEILEDTQLQSLYQKVIRSRPKLNSSLNDTVQKYNNLIEMNGKISDIMNIYDQLLEKQLNAININQQFSIKQTPSDPYAYYQQVPQQGQRTVAAAAPMGNPNNYVTQTQSPTVVKPQPAINSLDGLVINNNINSDAQPVASEPPYPIEEESLTENMTERRAMISTEQQQESPNQNRDMDKVEGAVKTDDVNTTKNVNITSFDFPTVPNTKTSEVADINASNAIIQESEPSREELLLEL
ncbi:hypothetical protein Kpol_1018p17 [Vanderwaltozyma polyspora DSM 70294]|uniref:Vacuolar protein sorting-associated protein 27 n=1 Tax=Vanderwaltozyma polyspora (strain ATCC 22028 / DSM 70294 / BCRC 21397 / CBS 2163 / NBRC 10782 / NRRL Y-8283 / UCD 57-17) TaxID=436907 RepID=A7TDL9_VANPO|nr:uncharacterized protein Kpol_1018p17 [Vanderwaltozyma polyspora DSM 70294]EDO19489.1 hypothetical protein Kpol_1018p17 [Vanderwaltozyma polyspora DSM 70294]